MGASCCKKKDKTLDNEIKKKEKEKEEEEKEEEKILDNFKNRILSISDDQYVSTCCRRIPEFQEIDCKNSNIVLYCPEHGRKTIEIKEYFKIMNDNLYNVKCENETCTKIMKKSKKIFYHCFEDGKNYCSRHLPNK